MSSVPDWFREKIDSVYEVVQHTGCFEFVRADGNNINVLEGSLDAFYKLYIERECINVIPGESGEDY